MTPPYGNNVKIDTLAKPVEHVHAPLTPTWSMKAPRASRPQLEGKIQSGIKAHVHLS
jgi:hypothetical protein